MDIQKLLAKSDGMTLIEHSVNTANRCKEYAKSVGLSEELVKTCYYAGLLHDIAKAMPVNQDILKDDKKEKVFHSIEGGMFVKNELLVSCNEDIIDAMSNSIGYHHPKRYDDCDSLSFEENFNPVFECAKYLLENHPFCPNDNFIKFRYDDAERAFEYMDDHNCECKYLTESKSVNKLVFIISNVLKMADIVASGGSFPNNTKPSFDFSNLCPEDWDAERLELQKRITNSIMPEINSVITAFCSFGKSVVGFLHAMKSTKKMYWVMPMNSIAISMFDELVELDKLFGNHLTIGLYLATKQKSYDLNTESEEFDWNKEYDIVITNIDNYWSPMLKTSENSRCFSLLERDCVFDEYHNYISGGSSLFAGFKAIVDARSECKNISSVYLSGTQPYLPTIFGVGNYKLLMEGIDQFANNDKEVVLEKNNKSMPEEGSSLVFLNSVKNVVNNARQTDNVCIHSKFTEKDKNDIIEFILKHNGKDSTDSSNVSTTSIISNGVDVSFDNAVLSNPDWDLFYQLIGRVNRFNQCTKTPIVRINMPNLMPKDKEKKDSEGRKSELMSIKNSMYPNNTVNISWKELFNHWRNCICQLESGKIYKMSELYAMRDTFISDNKENFKRFQKSLLDESLKHLAELDYKSYTNTDERDDAKHNSKNNLRHDGKALKCWCLLEEGDKESLINIDSRAFSKIVNNETDLLKKYLKHKFSNEYEGKALRNKVDKQTTLIINKCRQSSEFAFPLFLYGKFSYSKKYGFETFDD